MPAREKSASRRAGPSVRVGLDLRILQGPGATQGIGTYLRSLAAALFRVTSRSDSRFEIVPFALPGRPFLRNIPARMPSEPVALHRPASEIRFLTDALNQVLTPVEVAVGRVALFHAPSPYDLSFFYPAPLVVTVHDLAPLVHPEWVLRTGLQHAFLYRCVRRARRIIAVSEFTKREIVERLAIPPERIAVVREAALENYRRPPGHAQAFKTARRLGLQGPFLLFVAGFRQSDPRKNAATVVDAFVNLLRTHPALTLAIVGADGPGAEPVRGRIRELRIESRVVWTGFTSEEDLVSLYSACEVFLFPTLYEGFGLPVLEAMGCGAAVVTARSGAVPEVAGDGVLYADPQNAGDIAARVREILGDRKLWKGLRERAMARAQEFSWERAAEETLAVYADALAVQPRGA